MGNTNIKDKFSLFNNLKLNILVKNKNKNDNIYSNKYSISNKLDYNDNNYESIYTLDNDGITYNIYANRLIPKLVDNSNSFILTYLINDFHFSYLSNGFLQLLDLSREYLIHNSGVFFKLIYPQDKIIFDRDLETTIKNRDTKWKWIGKIKVNSIYNWFQIDSTIEYYKNYINIYSSISNINLLADIYQDQYKKIILDSCNNNKYNIPTELDNIELDNIELDNNSKPLHLQSILNHYIKLYSINDYYIDDNPEYIIYNQQLLSMILDGFFNNNVVSFSTKITTYDIEFIFYYSNDFKPSTNIVDLVIQYNGQYIYKDRNQYNIRLPYKYDSLTEFRPNILNTTKKKYDKTNTIYLIDDNKVQKTYIEKFLIYHGYNVISNNNFNNIDKTNDIIIYNTKKEFTIDNIRKLGYKNPIIISNLFDDIGYNYRLDYPFNEDKLLHILTEIYSKIKILYIDSNYNNIALNTSILENKLKYNLDIHNDLSILKHINVLDIYQLIIIDDSVIYEDKEFFSKYYFINKLNVPILYMVYHKEIHNSFFKNVLVKPFSIDILQKTIIECL